MRRLYALPPVLILGSLLVLTPRALLGQQIIQEPFEGRTPLWKGGSSDAVYKVLAHRMSTAEETAHSGQRCEHLSLVVEKGSYIHYTYDIPKAPITEDLSLSLWIKSNRPGVQLLCRVVLPRERDPNNAGQPLTALVRCDPYQSTLWKSVGLPNPVKRLREQGQLLTHQYGREVVTAGAYIDQLVLNVCDGPGQVNVWIDDLEVGPVEQSRGKAPAPAPVTEAPGRTVSPGEDALPAARRSGEVQLRGSQLWVGRERFFLRGIRHTGTPPLRTLRDANFNTVWLDESTPPAILDEAVSRGFWIVPSIVPSRTYAQGAGRLEGLLTSRGDFGQKVSRFMEQDAVLAWDLGSNLYADRFADVSRLARAFRVADPHRPVMADVWEGYKGYSRSIEQLLMGTHRWPLLTSLELPAYREWLDTRRRLASDAYCWTWVQTHLPDWFVRLRDLDKDSFAEPIGPLPEQIRLLTYTAIAAGYRGLAFWSDRYLADSHQGKDRLLAMALLNQEIQLLERLLLNSEKEPGWVGTSRPEVQAAVFRGPEGVLVLPIWVGAGSQFVPGQAAASELTITIPGIPVTATAWEVSPGRIQSYPVHRDVGGSTVVLRNFSLTSAIVFTSDLGPNGLIVRLQNRQRDMGRLAAQWLDAQAREELAKVEKVQAELERLGHTSTDAKPLLQRARQALELSMQHRRNGMHSEAYGQAEVALRALRVLMRSEWDRAVRDLDSPVSSPFAVSFYTLPRHWRLLDELKESRASASVLPGGDFESEGPGWRWEQVPPLDDVTAEGYRVSTKPHGGQQCLMMQVQPKDPKRQPAALERTYVALQSPVVKLPPGSLVRISAWVNIPRPITASVDGALLFDSVGGEPLGIRLVAATTKWQKFSLYRKVPASGEVRVTLALSGLGTVYFDDVRVEPLVHARGTTTARGQSR